MKRLIEITDMHGNVHFINPELVRGIEFNDSYKEGDEEGQYTLWYTTSMYRSEWSSFKGIALKNLHAARIAANLINQVTAG
jgi:hypothetical protein